MIFATDVLRVTQPEQTAQYVQQVSQMPAENVEPVSQQPSVSTVNTGTQSGQTGSAPETIAVQTQVQQAAPVQSTDEDDIEDMAEDDIGDIYDDDRHIYELFE